STAGSLDVCCNVRGRRCGTSGRSSADTAEHAAVGHNGGDRRGARRARGPKRVDGRGGHRQTRAARAFLGCTRNGGDISGRVRVRAGRLGDGRALAWPAVASLVYRAWRRGVDFVTSSGMTQCDLIGTVKTLPLAG